MDLSILLHYYFGSSNVMVVPSSGRKLISKRTIEMRFS